uniref:protein S100-A12-like n=1 Tax=Euleptes europaea TaxID=460621 RepID=UPI002540219A|nr:protein S100-A12-like [Euleptes europaea]
MSQTPLEKCCECIINIFHQYSVRVDHFDMLSKGELKKMVEEQMPNFLKGLERKQKKKDPKFIDSLFEELDKDKSGQITFEECLVYIGRVLIACHDHIHGHGHSHSH